MPQRAIFLDRDNTLIDNDGYLGDPAKVRLLPGAAAALTALRALGYRLIVVSNQSGVARGMFTEADVEAVNNEVSRQLKEKAGAYIDASYYCPYHPDAPIPEFRADHDWRKPKPGMLLQAATDFDLDLNLSWMIGDSWRDVSAGTAAGCRTILLVDPERAPANDPPPPAMHKDPNYIVKTLADAARIIAREGGHGPESPSAPEPPAAKQEAPPPLTIEAPPKPAASYTPSAAPTVKTAQVVTQPPAPIPVTAPAAVGGLGGAKPSEPKSPEVKPLPASSNLPQSSVSTPTPELSRVTQHLDELVVQLRQQNRNAELRPDFSFSNMATLVAQGFGLVFLILGIGKYFTMKVTYPEPQDIQFALMAHLQAIFWLVAAVFMQGVVVALLIYNRGK